MRRKSCLVNLNKSSIPIGGKLNPWHVSTVVPGSPNLVQDYNIIRVSEVMDLPTKNGYTSVFLRNAYDTIHGYLQFFKFCFRL